MRRTSSRRCPGVWRALVLGLAALAAACGGSRDLAVRQRVTDSRAPATPTEEIQYLTTSGRITDDPHARTIVDLRENTLTTIDKDKKTYSIVTFDDLRRESAAQERRLRDAPAEVTQILDPPMQLVPTGKRQSILGHDTAEYTFSAGEMKGSVWVTNELRVPTDTVGWQRFVNAMHGLHGSTGKVAEGIAALGGLPLRATSTVTVGEDTATMTTEVLDVQRLSPPSELRIIPQGFRQVEAPILKD
jgi:hypothetical protein